MAPFHRARFACCIAALFLAAPALPAFDDVIDSPMYRLPDLSVPKRVPTFPEGLKPLWLRALERPEADVRRQAAEAIALAHRRGMSGLETTVAPLTAALEQADQHPAVRLAVARTLVALDTKEAAPALFRQSQAAGGYLRELVEPALARWDYRPARDVWLGRLGAPGTPARTLALAIGGLGAVREARAAEPLRALVTDARASGPTRLQAARALARVRPDGLEGEAEKLAADEAPAGRLNRLIAVSLLREHRSEQAVRLLQRLARDPDPTITAHAATRLLELDPDHALPARDHLVASADSLARSAAVELLGRRATREHLRLLGDRLADAHPDVRRKARETLRELAGSGHRPAVLEEGTRMLATNGWQAQEQAAILLTRLEHRPAADRLVELLTADRPEVFITVGWALRKLAVPETLPRVLSYTEAELRRELAGETLPGRKGVTFDVVDHQLSQLNQFLGQEKYRAADPVLRRFVPKLQGKVGGESRAAAVWALGLFHEGKGDPELASALEGRLNDTTSIPPEDERVRRMSAIALGRLKARPALPSLQKQFTAGRLSEDVIGNSCGWAISQITGEPLLPALPVRQAWQDWFLLPNDQ